MTTKPKVTLATSSVMPNLYHGEEGLLDALAERGCDPSIKIWNDPDVDWTDAGTVIVRSVSDYPLQRQAFLEWTKKVPRILNHPDILEWNTHKTYLRSLEKRGLPTIPTAWLEPEQNLSKHQIHTRFPASGEFIVKPAVSSGVRDIGRYTTLSTAQRQAAIAQVQQLLGAGRTVMLQRYLEEIDTHGEISLVFFNGLVSHAVEKRAVLHPATITESTMHEAVVTAEAADHIAWQWGEQIRRVLHAYVRERIGRDEQFLFNRVDIVPDDEGSFRVMEVSLVDADLYLAATPEALGNFADAIAVRAHW
ncbi:ATP-grasp domain-containing protein [Schaalia cardiffensis]